MGGSLIVAGRFKGSDTRVAAAMDMGGDVWPQYALEYLHIRGHSLPQCGLSLRLQAALWIPVTPVTICDLSSYRHT